MMSCYWSFCLNLGFGFKFIVYISSQIDVVDDNNNLNE